MKTTLKKTLLAALPLVGLLFTAPAAFARHWEHRHHHWEHRSYSHPYYDRGWRERWRHNYDYRPGWHRERRYYNGDDYYGSRYPQQPYYEPWWQSFYR